MKTTLASFGSLLLFATIVGVSLHCNSLHAQVFNPANGHYYEYVDQDLNWENARQAAESRMLGGVNGYLATVTSQTEQDFLASNFPIHAGWLGGLQTPGAIEPDQGWTWITGEPFVYLGWSPSEPNNIFGDNPNENRITFFGDGGGFWSDAPDSFTGRLFVEYNVGAELFRWSNAAGGDYHNATNWSANYIPTTNDPAIFDLASSSYVVTAAAEIATASLAVHNDDVSLDLGDHTWILPQNNTLVTFVGDQAGDIGKLTLVSGTVATGRTYIGHDGNAQGTLIVNGPTAHFAVVNSALFAGGNDASQGSIQIRNGGRVSLSGEGETNFYIGPTPDSTGSVLVTGAGSKLETASILFVGQRGTGSLNVITDGHVDAQELIVGGEGHGTLEVDAGVVNVSGQLSIGLAETSDGTLQIRNGGTMSAGLTRVGPSGQGELTVQGALLSTSQLQVGGGSGGGVVAPPGSGSMTIAAGGIVNSTQAGTTSTSGIIAAFNPSAHGAIHITGVGSKWIQDGNFSVGSVGSGSFRIEDQGYAECVDAQVARTTTATADVHVDGAGSRWSIQDRLIVGGAFDAAGGAASVEATNGGRITAGELLHVWSQGEIDLTGGGSVEVGAVESPASGVLQVGEGGTLSGTGTIIGDVLVDGGTVTPGASPGALHINGNFHQLAPGFLTMEIGGTMPGTEYDQLLVTGDLLLEGAVQLAFINGFVPQVGDKFDLFAASSAQLTGPLTFLNAPPNLQYSSSFDNGVFSIVVVPEPSTGTLLIAAIAGFFVSRTRRRPPYERIDSEPTLPVARNPRH
jgi:T5SS/PEP-CTERM-associated repeat protein